MKTNKNQTEQMNENKHHETPKQIKTHKTKQRKRNKNETKKTQHQNK